MNQQEGPRSAHIAILSAGAGVLPSDLLVGAAGTVRDLLVSVAVKVAAGLLGDEVER